MNLDRWNQRLILMSNLGILAGLLLVAMAVATGGQTQPTSGGFFELHRAPVMGSGHLEVVMGLVERSGASVSPKHYHPGGEFGFVLEGAATVVGEGGTEVVLKAGDSFHQPAGEWHVVSSGAAGAKSVVFRVVERGQPMVVEIE